MAGDDVRTRLLADANQERQKDRKLLRAGLLLSPEYSEDRTAGPPAPRRGEVPSPAFDDEELRLALESSAREEEARALEAEERAVAEALAASALRGKADDFDPDELAMVLHESLKDPVEPLEDDPQLWEVALQVSKVDLGPRGASQVAKIMAAQVGSSTQQQLLKSGGAVVAGRAGSKTAPSKATDRTTPGATASRSSGSGLGARRQ